MSSDPTTASTQAQNSQQTLRQLLPVTSAADVGFGGRITVRFDDHIGQMLREHARSRSPSPDGQRNRSYRDHLIGVAAEVATATWRHGAVDTRVLDDFEGDDGVDVIAPTRHGTDPDRFQVKATREMENPERVINRDQISNIDYAVLCCTDSPTSLVEIVGYAPRFLLDLVDDGYGSCGPILREEMLYPVSGRLYQPKDVREAVGGSSWR